MYNYRNNYGVISEQQNKGTTLKDFQIIKKLGEGSFGVVYQVKRLIDNNIYALKKVRLANMPQKDKENALNEIRILASVESDFVISYKEAFLDEDSSTLCLVLELCETGDMLKILQENQKKNKPESEESLWKCLTQLALGLKALHSNNILHRDLKCANVFVSKEGIYKLGDLNVSKVSKHGLVTTQTGTPYYASPEVWQDKPYGAKSDIWSLGCVIYEMATFKPPFRAQDMKGLYKKVVAGKYDPIGSKYSSALQNMIARLLQVDPSKRPSAEEILIDPIVQQFINKHQLYQDNAVTIKQDLLQTIIVPRNLKGLLLPKSKYEDKEKEKEKEKEQQQLFQQQQALKQQQVVQEQQRQNLLLKQQSSQKQRVMSADQRQSNLQEQYSKLIEYQNSRQQLNPKIVVNNNNSNNNSAMNNNNPMKPPINKPSNYHNYNQISQQQSSNKKPNLPMPQQQQMNNNIINNQIRQQQGHQNNRQNYLQQLQQNRPSSQRSNNNQQRYGSVDRQRANYDYILQSPKGGNQNYLQSPRGSNQRLAAGQAVVNNQLLKPSWYG